MLHVNPLLAAVAAAEEARVAQAASASTPDKRMKKKRVGDWVRYTDPEDGSVYWHNSITGASEWELPTAHQPLQPEPAAPEPVVEELQPAEVPAEEAQEAVRQAAAPTVELPLAPAPVPEPSAAPHLEQWAPHPTQPSLWVHPETGAEALLPPTAAPPTPLQVQAALERAEHFSSLQADHEQLWVRGPRNAYWVQPGTGRRCVALPSHAHTACGWWQHGALSGMVWRHKSSGASSPHPPPLNAAEAERAISAYLESGGV